MSFKDIYLELWQPLCSMEWNNLCNYSRVHDYIMICSFDLILYVPSTLFRLNRAGSSWVEPVPSYDKCVLFKDHNPVTPVRLEQVAPRSSSQALYQRAPEYIIWNNSVKIILNLDQWFKRCHLKTLI